MSKPKTYRLHEDATAAMFRRDPKFAAENLSHVQQEGDQTDLMLTLRQVINAFGGIAELAQRTHLNATTLYRRQSGIKNTHRSARRRRHASGGRAKQEAPQGSMK